MKSSEIKCQLCQKEFSSLSGLHGHLSRAEKINKEDYYAMFFPRRDLLSGKQLPFKDFEDYFSRRFVDKKNEFKYLIKNGLAGEGAAIISEQLDAIKAKSSRFPTYCEWRSSKNIRYDWMLNHGFFADFLKLAREKKFAARFDYSSAPKVFPNNELAQILVDTREQQPLLSCEKSSINVGDYTFESAHYTGVHVDRKSQQDFISTFTAGLDRFKRECDKAAALGINLVVLVESSFSDCFNYRPKKYFGQRVDGQSAFYGVREVSRAYDIQFLFVENREEAVDYLRKILSNRDLVRTHDLQFLFEKGLF